MAVRQDLRHDVPKGKRVLLVYDKAGIDHDYWKRCRHERAVYFLSRVKEGMVCDWIASPSSTAPIRAVAASPKTGPC